MLTVAEPKPHIHN